MSYEVLARKWRPQTFDEVVGQDHITRTLKKAVESSRIAHAYLFSGPRGCGKTSTARILAKVINCSALDGGNPCNKCASCVGVMEGRNLDVMEIDGASHTGVNEVRDLQEAIGYVPSQFANKVYIIDEVHMLSTHAFNALLKTLEEPPGHVYFVFATTAPHKIPDTIKSRCQRHQFKRLEVGEITDHLAAIAKSEKVKTDDDALRLLARKAEGSMRDAESLFDQCITASSGAVDVASVRSILGLLDQAMVLEFIDTMAGGDASAVFKALDKAIGEGVDLEELLNALIEGFRDLMLLAAPGDLSDLIYRSKEEIASLRKALDRYELADIVAIVERLCNVSPRLKMASDPRILLESALADITLLDRQQDLRELIERLEGSGSAGSAAPPAKKRRSSASSKGTSAAAQHMDAFTTSAGDTPQPVSGEARPPHAEWVADAGEDSPGPKPSAGGSAADFSAPQQDRPEASRPGPVSGDVNLGGIAYADARRLWDGFVTHVRQKKLSLGVCLISGTLRSIDDDAVMLSFAKGFTYQRDQVAQAANQKFLRGALHKYFGRELELVCFTEGEERAAEREKSKVKQNAGTDAVPKTAIEAQPLVRKILDDFDGEIVRYHPQ